MKTTAILVALAGFALPAHADDACDDLWMVRNLIFAQNGYCFGSTLGQSVFGNGQCTTKSPTLSPADKAKVAEVKTMEKRWQCNVDTNKTYLDVHSMALRAQLVDQPLHDDTESSCINYLGATAPLYAGHSTSSRIIGYVHTGSDFGSAHFNFSGTASSNWSYVSTVSNNGVLQPDIGWTNQNLWSMCAQMAG